MSATRLTQANLFAGAVDPIAEAQAILDGAIERYAPSHVFALFSGGHDSLVSTHLVSQHSRFTAVVHVNTGIGIERTREFVRETCQQQGWPLLEMHPPGPPFRDKHGNPWGTAGQAAYEAIVMRWGFPGPKGHTLIYNRLKERCLRRLELNHQQNACTVCSRPRKGHGTKRFEHPFQQRRIVLVTGVRKQESRRRMGHIVPVQEQDSTRLWVAPLVNWDTPEKNAYITNAGLPRNPVADFLCMSGECLCGAFARPGELNMVEAICPQTATYIRNLEQQLKAAGHKRWQWGRKPPARKRRNVQSQSVELPMCYSCLAKVEQEEDASR